MTHVVVPMVSGPRHAAGPPWEGDTRGRSRSAIGNWRSVIAVILLCGVTAMGCGRRGAPVLPHTAAPEAVSDLTAGPEANTIILTWSRPARSEDGAPLKEAPDYLLYRRSAPLAAGALPPAGPRDLEGYALIATVRGQRPANARVEGSLYAFRDDGGGRGLAYGQRYAYRVVARNRRGFESQPSTPARVDLSAPAVPPSDLAASAGEGRVDLAWVPPRARVDGSSLDGVRGYNIYRSNQPGAFPDKPVNLQPVVEARYTDAGLINDRTYFYVVRAVTGAGPPWQESGSSNLVSGTPRKVTLPAPPRNLQAAVGRSEVSLIWDANTEPDLAGYLVYRSEIPHAGYRRLTPRPIQRTTYGDRSVARGTTYYYVVTAVDNAATPNESFFSTELIVHVP